MTDEHHPLPPGTAHAAGPEPLASQEAWKTVYFGQVSQELVPFHPDPPETAEEQLTREAMEDPAALTPEPAHPAPTLWRLVALLVVAIGALAMVFWR
jgi:hypothetical protein